VNKECIPNKGKFQDYIFCRLKDNNSGQRRNNNRPNRRNRQKKNKCILFREGDFETVARRKFVSGSVQGNCREVMIHEANSCQCADIGKTLQATRSNLKLFDDEDGQASVEDFEGEEQSQQFRADFNQLKCPGKNVKRCGSASGGSSPPLVKGQYCVDYHIYYADGNEIKFVEDGVPDAFACRKMCEANARCRFYSFSEGSCSLLEDDSFIPEFDDTATSGSVQGECRNLKDNGDYYELGICECQEFNHDQEYDYEEADLVGLGLIDVRSSPEGASKEGCPDGQGKRCYLAARSKEPLRRSNFPQILRSSILSNRDAVIFS